MGPWENIKCANIHIIDISEGEEREKEKKNLPEEITAEKFLNPGAQTPKPRECRESQTR